MRHERDEENAALIEKKDQAAAPRFESVKLGISLVAFMTASTGIIFVNNHLLRSGFPYAAALIWLHCLTNFVLTRVLFCVQGEEMFPGLARVRGKNWARVVARMVPLALAIVLSLTTSNEAYRYCSIPFLQMCKQFNLVTCYVAGLFLGLEQANIPGLLVVVLITAGGVLNVTGEVHYNGYGFRIQMLSALGELARNCLSAVLLTSAGYGMDVLSLLYLASPMCLAALSLWLGHTWDPLILTHAAGAWPGLLASCGLAAVLNIASYSVVKYGGMVTFVGGGITKDVVVVLGAAVVLGQAMSRTQLVAAVLVLSGVCLQFANKLYPEVANRFIVGRPEKTSGNADKGLP